MTEVRRLGGRYEINGLLGRGGMAEVHRGVDVRLGRTVAVKTLRSDLARDETFQARFRREAQSAASLNHPSVVAVYDTGEEQVGDLSVPYIVMEHVDGTTLKELLASGRRLLPERALEITVGILQALDYSHKQGIVHRDIKPANVMLTRTGAVKVMDFGIARAVADTSSTMTQTAAVMGTAQYLSPEQARGERVDARSDLYSTGCVLFELLTGRPPFTGDSPVSVAYQHVREDPDPPSRFDPEVPPAIDAIVMKALAKHADNRYQTAAEMRADIERVLAGSAPLATPLLAAPVNSGATVRVDRTTVLPDAAPPGPPRGRRGLGYLGLALAVLGVFVAAALVGNQLLAGRNPETPQVTVPNVRNLPLAQAQNELRTAGLQVGGPVEEASERIAAGRVIDQDPAARQAVPQGTEVTLTVSTGPPLVSVPEVVDFNRTQAEQAIRDAGLRARVNVVDVRDAAANQVVEQSPAAGQEVRKGSTVTLTVASGEVRVPNVVGQSRDSAIRELDEDGLEGRVVRERPSRTAPGTVVEQSPAAGETVAGGSTVELVVSSGPPPTPTPTPPPPAATPPATPPQTPPPPPQTPAP